MYRAQHVAAVGIGLGGGVGGPGDAEIRHLDVALHVHQDVLGLDVPVHHVGTVGAVHRRQYLEGDLDRPLGLDAPGLADDFLQGAPPHVLHDDIAGIPVLAHAVDAHDVLVAHLGGGLGLQVKAAHEVLILVVLAAQDLHRHLPAQLLVPGQVDHRHAPGPDLVPQHVTAGQYPVAHGRSSS